MTRRRRKLVDWGQERQALYSHPETDPARRLLVAYQALVKDFTTDIDMEVRSGVLAGIDEIVRLRHALGESVRKSTRRRDHYRSWIRKLMADNAEQRSEIRRLNQLLNDALKGEVTEILEAQRTKHKAVVAELRARIGVDT